MRVSLVGSTSPSGSFHGVAINPSPLVSSTVGHQPCDARWSPVSSYIFVFSLPTTSVEPLSHSVPLALSANWR